MSLPPFISFSLSPFPPSPFLSLYFLSLSLPSLYFSCLSSLLSRPLPSLLFLSLPSLSLSFSCLSLPSLSFSLTLGNYDSLILKQVRTMKKLVVNHIIIVLSPDR